MFQYTYKSVWAFLSLPTFNISLWWEHWTSFLLALLSCTIQQCYLESLHCVVECRTGFSCLTGTQYLSIDLPTSVPAPSTPSLGPTFLLAASVRLSLIFHTGLNSHSVCLLVPADFTQHNIPQFYPQDFTVCIMPVQFLQTGTLQSRKLSFPPKVHACF